MGDRAIGMENRRVMGRGLSYVKLTTVYSTKRSLQQRCDSTGFNLAALRSIKRRLEANASERDISM